ncbi:hypothetical protein [Cohnella thailandensis]|uniref:GNAT family N-acetyltransferase n=1 Tax=Cohnella thailandensis TaxID=557557 RepID=A0A841SZK1_9BACL|nr:hypothetical protein [Cohnella thailandensis]MBB6635260.1 hypothetical protein [Cohnella thailandensis]MBP1974633.1 hypothetical protein [Cohnella thailandensis]
MAIRYSLCVTDDDFARASLFILDNRRDLHPAYDVLSTVSMLYQSIAEGHLVKAENEAGQLIGLSIYQLRKRMDEKGERTVAFAGIAAADRNYRGSRIFVGGLKYMTSTIKEKHPEAAEFELAAFSDNRYLCELYSKFARKVGTEEHELGEMSIYRATIDEIRTRMKAFDRL